MKSTKTYFQTKPKAQSVTKPALRRPKKCHLCNRMIAADKYSEHYENCYRFKDKNPVRNASIAAKPTNKPNKPQNKQLDYQMTKKMSKSSIARNTGKNFRIKSNVRIQQPQPIKKQQKTLINKQEKKEQKKQFNLANNPSIESEQQILENPIIRVYNPQVSIHSQSQRSYNQQANNTNQQAIILNSRNQPIVVLQNPQEFFSNQRQTNNLPPSVPHNETLNSLNPNNNNQPYSNVQTMEQLINNSNEIINFIEQLEDIGDDGSLQIMVSQLRQLNLVAGQVRDLDQVGMHLGYHLGQIFGNRIRQLQATIIQRVGFMLVRRFQQRIGAQAYIQLQNLFERQPQIRVGFSKAEIAECFPDKIALSTEQCPICLQIIEQGGILKQLQCDHFFHSDCIQRWLESSKQCPMCRREQRA